MKLVLAFLLGMVILGLVSDRMDRRVYALILGGSVVTAGLFYRLERFWT